MLAHITPPRIVATGAAPWRLPSRPDAAARRSGRRQRRPPAHPLFQHHPAVPPPSPRRAHLPRPLPTHPLSGCPLALRLRQGDDGEHHREVMGTLPPLTGVGKE